MIKASFLLIFFLYNIDQLILHRNQFANINTTKVKILDNSIKIEELKP